MLLDGVDWSKENWPPLSVREISMWCATYLENPNITPDIRFVKLLMWQFLKSFPEAKTTKPQEDAQVVDVYIDFGLSVREARQLVAEKHAKDIRAVQKAHQLYGKHKLLRGRAVEPEADPVTVERAWKAVDAHLEREAQRPGADADKIAKKRAEFEAQFKRQLQRPYKKRGG